MLILGETSSLFLIQVQLHQIMVHIYLKRGVNDDRVIHLISALNRQQIVILVKETNFTLFVIRN